MIKYCYVISNFFVLKSYRFIYNMDLKDAIDLIQPVFYPKKDQGTWADLGCGNGLFTKGLAMLLPEKSKIYAVDKSFQKIESFQSVSIEFIQADFIESSLPFENLDGMLMANSLHYVRGKKSFLHKIKNLLSPDGKMLIIEYDTPISNHWVPYPVTFEKLRSLMADAGFQSIEKIGRRKSIYNSVEMYAALISGINRPS